MRNHIHKLAQVLAMVVGFAAVGSVSASSLNDIYQVANQINQQAKRSQAKIDALTDETRKLLNEYKTVLKEIEGLRVYNAQLDKQIKNQEQEMEEITASIDQVTLIERQITPFMLRMIDGLEQFIGLDQPFLLDERMDRVERLRETMDRADVAVSEKFNQVFRAYQIENDYGRTMESYGASIELGGAERQVEILKVGRIALVYQTPDGEETGVWNKNTGAWEPLSDDYAQSVRNGIKMARKQLAVDLITLPVLGPEAAQ